MCICLNFTYLYSRVNVLHGAILHRMFHITK
nr:MAG TPA: hypothetical protein [Caudoviricetes sp.]